MSKEQKVYVIVVTYKGMYYYDGCFNALLASDYPIHIVVFENGSNDGSAEYIAENFPEITLMKSDENLGFGQGNNRAIRYALDSGADAVLLLNQDACVEPNTIRGLVEAQLNNPEYDVLSPINYISSKESVDRGYLAYFFQDKCIGAQILNDYIFNNVSDVYPITNVCATIWYLTSDVLRIVGGFDPIFFFTGEDDNYLQRVNYHKFKIGVCPHIVAIHRGASVDAAYFRERSIYRESKAARKSWLFIEWANINVTKSISCYIAEIWKQIIKSLLLFRWGRISMLKYDLELAYKYRKQIIRSRENNIERKESWL